MFWFDLQICGVDKHSCQNKGGPEIGIHQKGAAADGTHIKGGCKAAFRQPGIAEYAKGPFRQSGGNAESSGNILKQIGAAAVMVDCCKGLNRSCRLLFVGGRGGVWIGNGMHAHKKKEIVSRIFIEKPACYSASMGIQQSCAAEGLKNCIRFDCVHQSTVSVL